MAKDTSPVVTGPPTGAAPEDSANTRLASSVTTGVATSAAEDSACAHGTVAQRALGLRALSRSGRTRDHPGVAWTPCAVCAVNCRMFAPSSASRGIEWKGWPRLDRRLHAFVLYACDQPAPPLPTGRKGTFQWA